MLTGKPLAPYGTVDAVSQWSVRSADESDQQAMSRLAATCFGAYTSAESRPPWQVMIADGGSVVVEDHSFPGGAEIAGMARYLDMELTVPGGATLRTAGISADRS